MGRAHGPAEAERAPSALAAFSRGKRPDSSSAGEVCEVWYNAVLRITDSRVVVSYPLYRPDQERDACGTGFVADISGRPSRRILEMALTAVTDLTHRGALDADAKTGAGPLITGSEETCPLPRG